MNIVTMSSPDSSKTPDKSNEQRKSRSTLLEIASTPKLNNTETCEPTFDLKSMDSATVMRLKLQLTNANTTIMQLKAEAANQKTIQDAQAPKHKAIQKRLAELELKEPAYQEALRRP
jgi:hypothetical protein